MTKKNKPKLTSRQEKFLTAFDDLGCNVSASCLGMKISRETFYRWKRESELFAQRVGEIEEAELDWVETKLKSNIRNEKEASIFFYLKTKGKHRGYIETQKIEHEGEMSFLQVLQEYSNETAVEPLDEITDNS